MAQRNILKVGSSNMLLQSVCLCVCVHTMGWGFIVSYPGIDWTNRFSSEVTPPASYLNSTQTHIVVKLIHWLQTFYFLLPGNKHNHRLKSLTKTRLNPFIPSSKFFRVWLFSGYFLALGFTVTFPFSSPFSVYFSVSVFLYLTRPPLTPASRCLRPHAEVQTPHGGSVVSHSTALCNGDT